MKLYSKIAAAAMMLAAATTGLAQQNMYLIKGDHIIGKYAVDAVDYISFEVPEGVQENDIWPGEIKAGKNTVSYTINAIDDHTAYAHNIVSYYDANYNALSYYGDNFENLEADEQIDCLKDALYYSAYLGTGTNTYRQTDYELDGSGPYSRFSVMPGTKYYACAWQVDYNTQEPMDVFVYAEFETQPAAESTASSSVVFTRQNSQGLAFDFSADHNVKYFRTAYGLRSVLETYIQFYGLDFTIGTFGQNFSLDQLEGMRPDIDDVENATWPVEDAGEYALYVRAYDYNGDYKDHVVYATAVGTNTDEGPEINVFTRSKGDGKVSVNFEITPSNVVEAYVNMMPENDVDDRHNEGFEFWEIASGSTAIDITNDINTMGEYTFKTDVPEKETWYMILITAKDKDGNRTTRRMSFFDDNDSDWYDFKPVYNLPARKAKAGKAIRFKNNPTMKRLK